MTRFLRCAMLTCLLMASLGTAGARQPLPDYTGEWVAMGFPSLGHAQRLTIQQSADELVIEASGGLEPRPTERFVVAIEQPQPATNPDAPLYSTRPRPTSSTARWEDGALTVILVSGEDQLTVRQTWALVGNELFVRSWGGQMRTIGGVSGVAIERKLTRYRKTGS